MNRRISSNQLVSLCFVAMLCPFFRLIPGSAAQMAGKAAWLSVALSGIPALALSCILSHFLSGFAKGTGLGEAVLRALGPTGGRILLLIWCLWLLFHCSFVACSGADRFIATIYPNTGPQLFIVLMLLICAIASTGTVTPLARASQIFRPLLLGVILLVLGFSLNDVHPSCVFPIFRPDGWKALQAIPLAAESVSVVLISAAFLAGNLRPDAEAGKKWPFLLGVTLLGVAVCLITIGNLGQKQTAQEDYPFFILLRDLRLFTGVERVDALVVALWLLPDFLLISMELVMLRDCLLLVVPEDWGPGLQKLLPWLCLGLTLVISLSIAPGKDSLHRWGNGLIPYTQLLWAYGVYPVVWLVSLFRKKF